MTEILFNIIIFPIIQILEISFTLSQKLFRETGISVIFIGIVISVLCLPLYAVAERWQQIERDTVKKLKPKVDLFKKTFKGDKRYMILSTYYRQNNYHPIYALRSSFGLLIQIPFFIAAYYYLSHLELLNGVNFTFIDDLSSPDALFSIGGFTINVLPLAMTFITCISSFIYTKGLCTRDKIQLYGMAAVFLILLYNSPSALVLYWTMNNVFSLLKNIYYRINSKYKHYFLIGLFSFLCIFFSVFCSINFYYIDKARLLSSILIFYAFFPWIFLIVKFIYIKTNIKLHLEKSNIIFFLSITLIWLLFGLFIPSQLIASSPQEFSFIDNYTNPLYFILNTSFQIFGLFIFYPVCLYFLFSNNVKKIFTIIFFIISVCMIINVFAFSGNYGVLSINFTFDDNLKHSREDILINIVFLLFIFAISLIIYILKLRKIIPFIISFCMISLFGLSIYNIFIINASYKQLSKNYIKNEIILNEITPIFTISQKSKNIVIIMLDRAISGFLPYILEESPELKNIYSGFVFYPNTVSFSGFTAMGSPPIFGGYEYTPEEMNKRNNVFLVEKHNQSLLMLPRIYSENKFNVTVTDPPYANYFQKCDISIFDEYPEIKAYVTNSIYTDFWLNENNMKFQSTSEIIKRNMFWYSILKGIPLNLRNAVYMDGTWCSPVSDQRLRLTLDGYSVLDFLPRLTKITSDERNNLLIMTNLTTHEGSFLQAPDYTPALSITNYGTSPFSKEHAYHINAAAIKRIADWIIYLKNHNAYDNTRIILVADHGPKPNFITKNDLPFNVDQFNPLLLVKDFNESGEMKANYSFMSNADVPYLSLKDVIENPVNPFTGNTISNERKNLPLYIAISGSNHVSVNTTQYMLNPDIDHYVHDNIFIKENWIKAGEK
ncbi:MAG: YidC/Oxa1 family membrane protein insertase [Treponema sp.]|nr:YidC/Oxa1 family membrane protein insertase [Treponema sp.]